MTTHEYQCPETGCDEPLVLVRDMPVDAASGTGSAIEVKLQSGIYRCPLHGLWQIYENGVTEPYLGTDR